MKGWLAALGVAAVLVGGCASGSEDVGDAGDLPATTTRPGSGADGAAADGAADGPTTGERTAEATVVARLAAVSLSDLVMGDAFNRQLLTAILQLAGFGRAEAGCVADGIVNQRGPAFDRAPLSDLIGASSFDPAIVMSCVPTERIQQITTGTGTPDIDGVGEAEFRQLLNGLATAGYEAAGLTPSEATCLAAAALEELDGRGAFDALQTGLVNVVIDEAMVRLCLTTERIGELSR